MASLRKFPGSKFFYACITLPNGQRSQRSTKEVTRKKAQQVADDWEKLTKAGMKAKQVHRVLGDFYRAVHGENLPLSTTRAYFESWLGRRKGEVAPATFLAYEHRAGHFLTFLGDQAERPLGELTFQHVVRYRDAEATRVSISTANNGVKTLRVFLEAARRDGLVADNVAKDVKPLRDGEEAARRPFTLAELQKVMAVANGEWRSIITFGLYTGQRLADLARLTWQNIDIGAEELQIRTAKSGRRVRIPLCKPLADHIADLPAHDDPKAPLHPRAFETVSKRGHASTLSRQFGELLAVVGLVNEKDAKHAGIGKGRSSRRVVNDLTFHCLRHTAVSMMKNAGISPAIVQDIIGHESAEISNQYTHIDSDSKRKALDAMPDLRIAKKRPRAKRK